MWGWLVLLLVLGLIAAYLPLPKSMVTFLVFAIATVKAAMVIYNYMHLRFENILIYAIVIVPILLFIVLTVALMPDIAFKR